MLDLVQQDFRIHDAPFAVFVNLLCQEIGGVHVKGIQCVVVPHNQVTVDPSPVPLALGNKQLLAVNRQGKRIVRALDGGVLYRGA